jgi:hypothetical protein
VPKKSLFATMCGCLGGKAQVEETIDKVAETIKEEIAEATDKEPVEEGKPEENKKSAD